MEKLVRDMCSPHCQPPRRKKRQRKDSSPQLGGSNPTLCLSQEGLHDSQAYATQPAAVPVNSGQKVPPSGGEKYSLSNVNELSILVNSLCNIFDNFKGAQSSVALLSQFKGAQSAGAAQGVYAVQASGAHSNGAAFIAGDAVSQNI